MVKPLLDTSILIDFLNAVPEARDEMARYPDKAVSIVTWMEVVIGAPSALADATRNFLNGYEIVALDAPVAERAVELRRSHRIKLPDAVIWATAQIHGMLLVTRNTRNFPADDPGIRLPYQL
jgi:predicted nucleic acid-binding protein